MQIDENWKLCQALKSVSPIRLRVNFGSRVNFTQFYSILLNFTLLASGTVQVKLR